MGRQRDDKKSRVGEQALKLSRAALVPFNKEGLEFLQQALGSESSKDTVLRAFAINLHNDIYVGLSRAKFSNNIADAAEFYGNAADLRLGNAMSAPKFRRQPMDTCGAGPLRAEIKD